MKEILFLNFGSTSNFISSHFWNLNDEIFKIEDSFNLNQNVIYNDRDQPRNLLFDYSENIRPYYTQNDKVSKKVAQQIEDDVSCHLDIDKKLQKIEFDNPSSNKFLDLINDIEIDEKEYEKYVKNLKQPKNKEEEEEKRKILEREEIFKLPEEKIYDYFDFEKSIKNWNDFLQPKFSDKSFNEIKMLDVGVNMKGSYLRGFDFFNQDYNVYTFMEKFEDNFRKFLEDCDRLEIMNISVDFNSFWGGVSSRLLENFSDEIPKVTKVYQGVDLHSSYFDLKEGNINQEKLVNYLWFFSDLYSSKQCSLFVPILKEQCASNIKDIFHYDKDNKKESDPVYDYYYSSLCALNLHNFYIPMRSRYYNDATNIYNLIHHKTINFYETETIFALDSIMKYGSMSNNGIIVNPSRNLKEPNFQWGKFLENSMRFNKHNSVVLHGYNKNNLIMNENIDKFLLRHSGFNYTVKEHIPIPICFPRKIYPNNKQQFIKELSVMTTLRPFPEYPLKYLKNIPTYIKENNSEVRKYLNTFDVSKYLDMRERVEEIYSVLDLYTEFSEHHNIFNFEDEESDEDITN